MARETARSNRQWIAPLREMLIAILLGVAATGPLWAMDWLGERRQEVEKMSPAEKEDLKEKYEKFLALPADEQEQIRLLHQKLEVDSNGDRLRGVMQRYYDWLKTLSPGERADLLALPLDARVAKIKTLKQDQEAWAAKLSGGSHLKFDDVAVLTDWVKTYAAAHEAELAKDRPPHRHGQAFSAGDPAAHERMRQFSAWRHWSGEKLPSVSEAEIDSLAKQLSPKPRNEIEAQHTLHDKAEIVHQWLQAIARTRFAAGFGKQGGNVRGKDLARFFEHLPKEKQEELSKITDRDEQRHELRRLYMQYRRANGQSPGAGGPGGEGEPHFNHGGPWSPDAGSKNRPPLPPTSQPTKSLPPKSPADKQSPPPAAEQPPAVPKD